MKNNGYALLVFILTALSITACSSQGELATAIENSSGDAYSPQIAADTDGNAIAVWHRYDTESSSIWANRYTADAGWSTVEPVGSGGGMADQQQIAIGSGGAIAIWREHDGARENIWANRYVAGAGWSTAEKIESSDAIAVHPQIAMDTLGNAIAVWSEEDSTSGNIWANRYVAGAGWGTAVLIKTDNAGRAFRPQITIDGFGNAIAVWHQSDGTRYNTWANRYEVESDNWSTAEIIDVDNTGDALSPQIASDSYGNAIAVWHQSDGTRDNIWANRYEAGVGWGTAEIIETDNLGNALYPQIAIDSYGNAIAVWHQSDGTRDNIWANRYDGTEAAWGTVALIETDNVSDALAPQIVTDAAGNAIVVWRQHDGTRDNIWANHYNPTGAGWSTADLIEDNNMGGGASDPQIAMDANGNAIAVWHQSDGINVDIWSNRYVAGVGWGAIKAP